MWIDLNKEDFEDLNYNSKEKIANNRKNKLKEYGYY